MSELREQAHARAVAKVYDRLNEGDFNAGVSAAEMPKTLRLVASSATRLATSFRSLRRFDIPGAFRALGAGSGPHYRSLIRQANSRRRDALKTGDLANAGFKFASNTWLEIKYGWRPLLDEVKNASDSLGRGFAKANSYDIKSTGTGSAFTDVLFDTGSTYKGNASGKRKVSEKVILYSRVTSPTMRSLAGLGLTNPATIAWELLPFSFVVDWFIPVGSFVDSLDATAGLEFTQGVSCVKETERWNAVLTDVKYSGSWYQVNWSKSTDEFAFERTVLTGYPDRTAILAKRKPLQSFLNTDKVVTSLALLSSVFNR
jgi:hypothetical protein